MADGTLAIPRRNGTGRYTLEVHLEEPGALLPVHADHQLHDAGARGHHHAGGQGLDAARGHGQQRAFVLTALSINGPIELERNPRYWDAASVRLKAVTYYTLPDSSAATSRYLAGDLDVTDRFQMEDFDWLRKSLGDEVRIAPYFGVVMLAMHTGRAAV